MKIKPLKRYRRPGFPTRAVLDTHPELLRLVPERWRENRAVLRTLAIVCGILSLRAYLSLRDGPASRVAPIFVHGEGRGAYGCIMVNPPALLSEAEARQVVVEEGRKAGIEFSPRAPTLHGVVQPAASVGMIPLRSRPNPLSMGRPLALDGDDPKQRIAYEFVSFDDLQAWQPRAIGALAISSVGTYDTRGAAEVLRDGLVAAAPVGSYAVFYDPAPLDKGPDYEALRKPGAPVDLEEWHRQVERSYEAAEERAREELRRQVRDFVAWLKGQGVI